MPAPKAYQLKEAAEALGCSTDHVRNLIRRGELRAVRLGTLTVIPVIEIDRVLGIQSAPPELVEAAADGVGRILETAAAAVTELLGIAGDQANRMTSLSAEKRRKSA